MKRVNLLPLEERAKASRERGLLYAILALVVVVLALGLVYVWQNSIVGSKESELAGIQAEQAAVQTQIAALSPYAQIQATRTAMTETAKGLYEARVSWSTILEEVSLVIPQYVRLQSMACTVPSSMQPGAAAVAAPAPPAAADVTFTGTTYTHKDVADFMTHLGLIPQFKNIQLTSSSGTAPATPAPSGTPELVTFTVTAQLRPYTVAPPSTALQAESAP